MTSGAWLYILRCADGSYYVGTTRTTLEYRLAEHNSGHHSGYTAKRLPVTLVYSQWFDRVTDAITAERQVKGWSRAKKEALIRGDFDALRILAKRRTQSRVAKPDSLMVRRRAWRAVSNHGQRVPSGAASAALALRDALASRAPSG